MPRVGWRPSSKKLKSTNKFRIEDGVGGPEKCPGGPVKVHIQCLALFASAPPVINKLIN